jgi:hypothetical protein
MVFYYFCSRQFVLIKEKREARRHKKLAESEADHRRVAGAIRKNQILAVG